MQRPPSIVTPPSGHRQRTRGHRVRCHARIASSSDLPIREALDAPANVRIVGPPSGPTPGSGGCRALSRCHHRARRAPVESGHLTTMARAVGESSHVMACPPIQMADRASGRRRRVPQRVRAPARLTRPHRRSSASAARRTTVRPARPRGQFARALAAEGQGKAERQVLLAGLARRHARRRPPGRPAEVRPRRHAPRRAPRPAPTPPCRRPS